MGKTCKFQIHTETGEEIFGVEFDTEEELDPKLLKTILTYGAGIEYLRDGKNFREALSNAVGKESAEKYLSIPFEAFLAKSVQIPKKETKKFFNIPFSKMVIKRIEDQFYIKFKYE